MANTLTFDQVSSILNAVMSQATGATELAPVDTASFITVAQRTLLAGHDPVMRALSQVLSRTIFAVRPYNAKFKGMMKDAIQYGNHVRKINYISKPAQNSKIYDLTDGQSIDQYVVNKPEAIQTNFYGGNVWQDSITRFEDQLDSAFRGPEEFGSFIAGMMTELSNKREAQNESMARAALCNFIGGKLAGDTSNVIHLLTEYKAATGLNDLTDETVMQPANFKAFMQWTYARIAALCSMMTERSVKFHTNLNIDGEDKLIMRHTPYDRQKIYLNAANRFQTEMMALADTFHDNYLRLADVETVNYWQNIDEPTAISVYESYLNADGTIHINAASGATPTSNDHVLGVIFDEDAVGITTINDRLASTPFNARGGYSNLWWSCNYRWWNDFTENGIVLLLD